MTFRVGQKVCCVDISQRSPRIYYKHETLPIEGHVYTVRDSFPDHDGCPVVRLEEIINPVFEYDETTDEMFFDARRFRPVKETNIDIFLNMLEPVRSKEHTVLHI